MSQPNTAGPEPAFTRSEDELEALLPWYVAGTATDAQRALVDKALADNPDLRRQVDLIAEEIHATRIANERAGHAPARSLGRLMDAIEREMPTRTDGRVANLIAPAQVSITGFLDWLRRPGVFAPVALAALLLLVGQAAVIAALLSKPSRDSVVVASTQHQSIAGTRALIAFVPGATSSDIDSFLGRERIRIIDGPLPGGLYTVQLSEMVLPQAERDARLSQIRQEAVVRLVQPN